MRNLYLALIHHPIVNKIGEKVTTSVTNLDIHDIARSCRTFGVARYFIVTPLELQQGLVKRILGHWQKDKSGAYNPDRFDALSIAQVVNSFEDVVAEIIKLEGVDPICVATGANFENSDGAVSQLLKSEEAKDTPILLIFGTGWGLHPEILEKVNFCLRPIYGLAKDGYNHLSVRSAVAIYLAQFANDGEHGR